MRIVLQRVKSGSVLVDSQVKGEIGHGFVLLLAVAVDDTEKDADWLVDKVSKLRLFAGDEDGSFMRQNIIDVKGSVLVVSQFTLLGDCRKGTRPSFTDSASPELAERLYEYFLSKMGDRGIHVESGVFGASMEVNIANDGPVTLVIDSVVK